MYPTVKAHRTAHWLWVQSWQDHIFRVISFTNNNVNICFLLEPDRDNIIKNIPLSWLVHRRLSQEYLISPQTGSESDLFHRWRVILAWLPAVDQWELCQTFRNRNGERRSQSGVRGTGNAERRTLNKESETGSWEWRSSIQTLIPCCYPPFWTVMRITAVFSVPVLVLGFPFPVPDFNNIHLVLTQIQTVICVSVSLQMCDNILFHYLCGCKMNFFRTVGLINTSIVYAITFCCCLG